MTSTYKEKIIKALSLVKTFDELSYVREKILKTDQINRRTKAGRELEDELMDEAQKKVEELTNNGIHIF